MSESLIRFRGVGKTFQVDGKPVEAVRGIDLEVRRGEFITPVGPSGGGKSTLLNLVAGFETPDRKSTRLNSSHVALSRMPSSA